MPLRGRERSLGIIYIGSKATTQVNLTPYLIQNFKATRLNIISLADCSTIAFLNNVELIAHTCYTTLNQFITKNVR